MTQPGPDRPLTDAEKHEVHRLIMSAGPLRAREWLVERGYDEKRARELAFEEELAIDRDQLEQEAPGWFLLVFLSPFAAVWNAVLGVFRRIFGRR